MPDWRFEWDEAKRSANVRKHGIDFADCEALFAGPTTRIVDDRFPYDEERFVTFGLIEGRVVAVAHVEANYVIRIISARKATRREAREYFRAVGED